MPLKPRSLPGKKKSVKPHYKAEGIPLNAAIGRVEQRSSGKMEALERIANARGLDVETIQVIAALELVGDGKHAYELFRERSMRTKGAGIDAYHRMLHGSGKQERD